MSADRSKRIAELNDQLRARAGHMNFGRNIPGKIVVTPGFLALESSQILLIMDAIRRFDMFTEDNDPHGEHDFGALELSGLPKIFWKIDYYADASCQYGSEAPENPECSNRVFTIMLAEEY